VNDNRDVRETGLPCRPGDRPVTLVDRVRATLRARHYSYRTEKAYVAWIKRFVRYHGMRHPRGSTHGVPRPHFGSRQSVRRQVTMLLYH